jgi:hypothetical protein
LILEVVEGNTQAYDYTATDLKQFLKTFGYNFYALDRARLQRVSIGSQASYENLICLPADSPLNPRD